MSEADKSPFKFLDSYSAEDQAIFFGRDREVEEVYDKVFQGKLLLVYGASGTGKSSIINCGLANKFNESDWFPIHIRRGGNIRRSMIQQLEKEAINKVELTDQEKMTDRGLQQVINSVYLDHFKPIYLIFDQFEELFIFGFKDEWKEFIASIRFLMDTNLDIHFIFVIRGEYLEFLSEFEELIPEFFDNRMRVEKMTRKKAEEIIQGPAEEFNIGIDDGFGEKLLKKLSPDKSQIELTFLQVFLDKIYSNAVNNAEFPEEIRFTNEQIEELGQLGDVLAKYVDEQLFKMDDPKAALTILKSFVSLQGTKVQNTLDEVIQYCGDLGLALATDEALEIIRSFINKRILKDHDDNGKYELRHDSLAQKIFERITNQERELLDVKQFLNHSLNEFQKRGTLLNDEDIGYVSFYERNLEISAEMRAFIEQSKKHSTKRLRNRRIRAIIVSVILLLLVTSVLGFFYSQQQRARAESLAILAQTEKEEAENQRSIAEQQKERAVANEVRANEQARIALNQRQLAEQSRLEAEQQRGLALTQKSIAEKERAEAEQAREAAIQSEREALNQKTIAQEQRTIALRLRTLSLAREMAIKSSYMTDLELKALLSLQALRFNQENNGNPYDPDIYNAIYMARQGYFKDENLVKVHSSVLKGIIPSEESYYTIGNDGRLFEISNTAKLLLSSEYAFEKMALTENNRLALGTQSGAILLFAIDEGRVERSEEVHSDDITSIVESNNELITSSLDGSISFLNQVTWAKRVLDLKESVHDLLLIENRIWALSGRNTLSIFEGMEKIRTYEPVAGTQLTKLAFNPHANELYLGSQKGDIWVWSLDTESITQILSGHSSAITDIKISNDTKFVATSSLDRTVRVWPIGQENTQPIVLADHDNWAATLAFNKNQILTGSYSGSLKTFDLKLNNLADGLCEQVGRSLTPEEWNEYLTNEIPYQATCEN